MTYPSARVGDRTSCPKAGHVGGVIVSGSEMSYANDRPMARVGDTIQCGCGTTDTIVDTLTTTEIEGRGAAVVGSRTAHGGVVVSGSPTVFLGRGGPGSPQAQALFTAARTRVPYARECRGAAAS